MLSHTDSKTNRSLSGISIFSATKFAAGILFVALATSGRAAAHPHRQPFADKLSFPAQDAIVCDPELVDGARRCTGNSKVAIETGCRGALYVRPDYTFQCEGNAPAAGPRPAARPSPVKRFYGPCVSNRIKGPNGEILCSGDVNTVKQTGCPDAFYLNRDATFRCVSTPPPPPPPPSPPPRPAAAPRRFYGDCGIADRIHCGESREVRCVGNAETAKQTGCPGAFFLRPDKTFRCEAKAEHLQIVFPDD